MDEDQQFCLRWNNHQSTLISVFDTLLEKETLVDCTLAAEGKSLKAHKVVLSACSPYFATLLSQQYDKHPIFILKDVKFQELRAMMDYMYRGEVNISQDQLAALLKAAESLQIKGLSDSSGGRNNGTQSASSHPKETSAAANKNAKGSGLTIEQKMPRLAADMDADLSESHEGSASPNARKRKKVRRRSIETNNVDNHDHHSNSSSHSVPQATQQQTQPQQQQQQQQPPQQTASTMPTNITSATSSANVLSVTKKTDQEMRSDVDMNETDDQLQRPAKEVQRQNNGGRKSISSAAPTGKTTTTGKDGQQDLIEPKNEYDESNEEGVEDLTLDEEEMMEELDQAGPSHGGEGSSQGYPQWPVDRSQDNEAFMSGQDTAGHHRDAQGEADEFLRITKIAGLSWDQWNAHLTMPLITQLREGRAHLRFNSEIAANATPIVNSLLKNGHGLINSVLPGTTTTPADPTDKNGSMDSCYGNNGEQRISEGSLLGSPEDPTAEGTNGTFGYTCGDCGRVYKLKSSLRNHQKWECGKDPQFQCPLCAYRAKQKMHIIRHMGRMHKGQSLELGDDDFAKMALHKMDESVINMGL